MSENTQQNDANGGTPSPERLGSMTGAEISVTKSGLQIRLERQGCQFNGQEPLANHEPNLDMPCYCGRPNDSGQRHGSSAEVRG